MGSDGEAPGVAERFQSRPKPTREQHVEARNIRNLPVDLGDYIEDKTPGAVILFVENDNLALGEVRIITTEAWK